MTLHSRSRPNTRIIHAGWWRIVLCSFHARGPERPQETQHTGFQKVLVLVVTPVSLFSTHYPQTFPPAAKSAPFALPAPVINLCSKLRTRETPETSDCSLNLCIWLPMKKISSIPGSMNSLETWFTWTGQMQNSDQIFADVQTVSTLQGTQMTAVLNRKQVLLYLCSLDHFGGKCKRAEYIFFFRFCLEHSLMSTLEVI